MPVVLRNAARGRDLAIPIRSRARTGRRLRDAGDRAICTCMGNTKKGILVRDTKNDAPGGSDRCLVLTAHALGEIPPPILCNDAAEEHAEEALATARDVLGLPPPPTALSEAQVDRAYKDQARKLHPDRCDAADVTKRMQEVVAARDVLKDYLQYQHLGGEGRPTTCERKDGRWRDDG